MIGRLRGTLVSRHPPWLLVDVGGVGYELQAPMSTIYELPPTGKEVVLLTHYVSRDDTVALYGFIHESDRALFRNLIKVSGIGPKIALAILSGVSSSEFVRLISAGDAQALTRIPGIGKKTAARILVEMRDRVDQLGVRLSGDAAGGADQPADAQSEALVALQQLGYKPAEAQRLVSKAAAEGDTAEVIIRKALRVAIGA